MAQLGLPEKRVVGHTQNHHENVDLLLVANQKFYDISLNVPIEFNRVKVAVGYMIYLTGLPLNDFTPRSWSLALRGFFGSQIVKVLNVVTYFRTIAGASEEQVYNEAVDYDKAANFEFRKPTSMRTNVTAELIGDLTKISPGSHIWLDFVFYSDP